MKRLKELLESNVTGIYEDFIKGVPVTCKHTKGLEEKLIELIESHPGISSSEVVRFISDFRGIPRVDISKIPPLDMSQFK